MKREIQIGNILIGGRAPVAIQSMTNTDTADAESTLAQIFALKAAGCEIVRVAAYDQKSARAIRKLVDHAAMPIVADVHFDWKIAVLAIENGASKVRINPGNIGSSESIARVVDAAKMHGVPIRVGANTGSLMKEFARLSPAEALVRSAMENVATLERLGFYDIVLSLKSSNVRDMIAAYRLADSLCDYPLHLGVTEAGCERQSLVKSAIGIGSLLADGVGSTIRVSITGDPILEIAAAKDILQCSGARRLHAEVISCPTCARTTIDVATLAEKVCALEIQKPLKIAVMGCVVNGPGEAAGADIAVVGAGSKGIFYVRGERRQTVESEQIMPELLRLVEELD